MRTSLISAIALVCSAGAQAADGWQSAAEPRARGWVAAMNTGDPAAVETFIQQNFTPAALQRRTPQARAELNSRLQQQTGGLTVTNVEASGTPERPELLVTADAKNGGSVRFRFGFESAAPYRVNGLGIEQGG